MTQVAAHVSVPTAGLCFLQSHPRTAMEHLASLAQGTLDVIPHQALKVCVSSFGDKTVHLPEQTTLGIVMSSPAHTVANGLAFPGVAGANQREIDGGEEGSDTNSIATWEDEVRVDSGDDTVRREGLQMLGDSQDMWSSRLGKICVANYRIDRTSWAELIHQAPYRAGQRSRKIKEAQTNRMRDAGVMKPTLAEWASQIVSIPRKNGTLRFCVDYSRLSAVTVRD